MVKMGKLSNANEINTIRFGMLQNEECPFRFRKPCLLVAKPLVKPTFGHGDSLILGHKASY